MTSQEFCYWLQGYFEVSGNETLTPEQVKIVKDHLKLVFTKVTPSYEYPPNHPFKDAWIKTVGDQSKSIMTCHNGDKISDSMHQIINNSPQYQIASWPFNGQTKEEYFKEHGYYPPASC